MFSVAREAGMLEELDREFPVLKPENIEVVTFVIDQPSINTLATQSGLEVPSSEAIPTEATIGPKAARTNMKMIGLAFHNYHDSYRHFPRHNGDGEGNMTGLSWRVHLLPYLDQSDLYEQFKLDEAWDSDHNKKLIDKMPDVFKSAGVTDAGKTSIHVFTGENSLFHGDKGPSFTQITDGTSNTILAVAAGPDTADIWTKPGGIPFDANATKKSLGTLAGNSFLVLMCDGVVAQLKTSIEDPTLALLVQPADGMFPDYFASMEYTQEPRDTPTVIVTLANPVDRAKLIETMVFNAEEETFEGQKLTQGNGTAIWFADDKTFVVGTLANVRKIITVKASGKPGNPAILSQLALQADVASAFDLESQAALIAQVVERNPFPGIGMIQSLKSISTQYNVTGKKGDKLVEVIATTKDAPGAALIADLLKGFLAQGKMMAMQIPASQLQTEAEKSAFKFVQGIVNSAELTQADTTVQFLVPVPEGFDKLPEILKPALDKARAAAEETKKKNVLKQLGLAFHNYESTFRAFPGAGRSADGQKGLSWRVHLLPFLDEAPLYNQFKLDEPWDSEHNKALIDKMPAIFKSAGVNEPNKTSYHVFVGPGAPFADDQAPQFFKFTDGLSNTILAVEAGPDTAEIWTKPGGLNFDPKDSIKALGKIDGNTFRILMGDGSVRSVPTTIPADTLRKLIQFADGEPVEF